MRKITIREGEQKRICILFKSIAGYTSVEGFLYTFVFPVFPLPPSGGSCLQSSAVCLLAERTAWRDFRLDRAECDALARHVILLRTDTESVTVSGVIRDSHPLPPPPFLSTRRLCGAAVEG